jgi:uncharacterized protein HemX
MKHASKSGLLVSMAAGVLATLGTASVAVAQQANRPDRAQQQQQAAESRRMQSSQARFEDVQRQQAFNHQREIDRQRRKAEALAREAEVEQAKAAPGSDGEQAEAGEDKGLSG